MKFDNLINYKNGWIVGNFYPSLYNTESNDIGILYIKSGEIGDKHFHKSHIEYNIIISGKVLIYEEIFTKGDIFIYEPLDKSNVIFIEDTILLVIKNPSTKKDKFYDTNIT
jgi:quercetin dioxygenase-like cupin family protein